MPDDDPEPALELRLTEVEGRVCVAILLHNASVIELGEGELIPGAALSADQARIVAAPLCAAATRIENEDEC